MTVDAIHVWLADVSTRTLFTLAGTKVTILSIITFILIIIGSIAVSTLFQRAFEKALSKRFHGKDGTLAALKRLVHYIVMFVGLGIALQTIGINMNALFAAGAVFAIAIGFAMQNVMQNFVSGIILLVERSIKPGDILEYENTVVKVMEMGFRTTVVRTWREEDLIIPNTIFSQATVKNLTLTNNVYSTGVSVGVVYSSDMEKVMKVLYDTANAMTFKLAGSEPRVMLQDFGDNSVNFSVFLSLDDPWKQRIYMSDLRKAIWFAFKEAEIIIAFPQMDVHFDKEVTKAISSFQKAI